MINLSNVNNIFNHFQHASPEEMVFLLPQVLETASNHIIYLQGSINRLREQDADLKEQLKKISPTVSPETPAGSTAASLPAASATPVVVPPAGELPLIPFEGDLLQTVINLSNANNIYTHFKDLTPNEMVSSLLSLLESARDHILSLQGSINRLRRENTNLKEQLKKLSLASGAAS